MGNKNLAMFILIVIATVVGQATWVGAANDLQLKHQDVSLPSPGGGGSCTQGTLHVVGDDKGWVKGIDYQAWADQRTFKMGDNLLFVYDRSKHNVWVVDEKDYEQCTYFNVINNVPCCGHNTVPVPWANATFGFFSSGNSAGHDCQDGMKFKITIPPE